MFGSQPTKIKVYFVWSNAWSNHHVYQTVLWRKCRTTILRSLACFPLKLYSSSLTAGFLWASVPPTLRMLCWCSTTRWLQKSLYWFFIILRNDFLQTVMQAYGRLHSRWQATLDWTSWAIPALSYNSMVSQMLHRVQRGEIFQRINQVKV